MAGQEIGQELSVPGLGRRVLLGLALSGSLYELEHSSSEHSLV